MSKNNKTQSEIEQNNNIECERTKLRLSNANNFIIGDININSLPGKFDQLKRLITNKIDILVLTETKLEETFPSPRFLKDGFSKPIKPRQKPKRWWYFDICQK